MPHPGDVTIHMCLSISSKEKRVNRREYGGKSLMQSGLCGQRLLVHSE